MLRTVYQGLEMRGSRVKPEARSYMEIKFLKVQKSKNTSDVFLQQEFGG